MQIFVYGSLRKGMYNYTKYLEGKSTFIDFGSVQGSLYALHGVEYPALLPGDHTILGEIYEIDEEVASAIDKLEGYQSGNIHNNYDKKIATITCCDRQIELPVYFFNMKKEENIKMLAELIQEHDYVAYMQNKKKQKE